MELWVKNRMYNVVFTSSFSYSLIKTHCVRCTWHKWFFKFERDIVTRIIVYLVFVIVIKMY